MVVRLRETVQPMVSRAPFFNRVPGPFVCLRPGRPRPLPPAPSGLPTPPRAVPGRWPRRAPSWEAGPPAVGRRLLGLKAALRIPRSHPWVRRRPAVRATPANPRPTTHRHHRHHHHPPSPQTRSHSGHTLPSSAATLPASQPRGSSGRPPLTPTGGGTGTGSEGGGGRGGGRGERERGAPRRRPWWRARHPVRPSIRPSNPLLLFPPPVPRHGPIDATPRGARSPAVPSPHTPHASPIRFSSRQTCAMEFRGRARGNGGERRAGGVEWASHFTRTRPSRAPHTTAHRRGRAREGALPATPLAPVPTPSHPHSTPFHPPPLLPALSARSHTQHPRACSASSHGGHHGQQMVRSAAGRRAHVSGCRGQEYQRGFFVGQGVKKAR